MPDWVREAAAGMVVVYILSHLVLISIGYFYFDSISKKAEPSENPKWQRYADACGVTLPPVYHFVGEANMAFVSCVFGKPFIGLSNELRSRLTPSELDSVVAHEMAHLTERGAFWTSFRIVRIVSGFLASPYLVILLWIALTPGNKGLFWNGLVPSLFLVAVVKYIARYREFRADIIGAELTSSYQMASTLRKLQAVTAEIERRKPAPLRMLRLLKVVFLPWNRVFADHPRTCVRIRRLEEKSYNFGVLKKYGYS